MFKNKALRRSIFSVRYINVNFCRLQDNQVKQKIKDKIPKHTKSRQSKFDKPIIPVAKPEKDEREPSKCINHTCHDTPKAKVCGRFDSGTPEEWMIFVDLILKSFIGQNVTTGPPFYKQVERMMTGDAKAEFLQQTNLDRSHRVGKFTIVMETVAVHMFPNYAYNDQRWYIVS